ncbi:hypothetical protein GCM10027597_32120 [Saccharopolyspora tripterygii]
MFTTLDGNTITWADGAHETIDTIILATGYRPDLSYLQPLGAINPHGTPEQERGISRTCPGLGYTGLEWQTSFSSATLRGVHREPTTSPASSPQRPGPANITAAPRNCSIGDERARGRTRPTPSATASGKRSRLSGRAATTLV